MATMTKLSPAEKKELVALGASLSEIRDLQVEGYSFEEIKDLAQSIGDRKVDDQQKQADRQAKATKRAMKPESYLGTFPFPEKSAFNPAGEDVRPRPDLRCKMFWTGVPLEKSTLSYDEIEMLNQLEPGVFKCHKGDGSPFEIRVEADRDSASGQLDKLKVLFRVRGADKHNHLGMIAYLTQMLAQQRQVVISA